MIAHKARYQWLAVLSSENKLKKMCQAQRNQVVKKIAGEYYLLCRGLVGVDEYSLKPSASNASYGIKCYRRILRYPSLVFVCEKSG
jgi:hypothetical protein